MADAVIEIVGQDELPTIVELYNQIYRPTRDQAGFRRRALGRYNALTMLARVGERPVGFLVGFENSPEEFFAWTYGVHPDFRRQGVAAQLFEAAGEWAKSHNYESIRLEVPNAARAMLHLAVHVGFDVAGVHRDPASGDTTVIFELALDE